MFDRKTAESVFRGLSTSTIESLPPNESFALMFEFYETIRAVGAIPEFEDGDMMLFQWGTYDWGDGDQFNLNLTRQIIYPDGEDVEIYQLGLTYFYQSDDELKALGEGNFWCHQLSDAEKARTRVFASAAFTQCNERTAISASLLWEHI